jgi:GNAT superfamily N-acetyltransferase
MEIRGATTADAIQICEVIRASITRLCVADHNGDPTILEDWLANKTPDNVTLWLSNANNINLVAAEGGAVLAAGCVTVAGAILLNYVSPAARFRGVSSALLLAMEAAARQKGNTQCKLISTLTAYRFYKRRGYVDCGSPEKKHGLTAFPMAKVL